MRHSLKTSASAFAIGATALLAGCATVPPQLAGNDFVATTPQQVVASNTDGQRVRYRSMGAAAVLRRHLWIYGVGGIIIPFPGIKIVDMILVALGLV